MTSLTTSFSLLPSPSLCLAEAAPDCAVAILWALLGEGGGGDDSEADVPRAVKPCPPVPTTAKRAPKTNPIFKRLTSSMLPCSRRRRRALSRYWYGLRTVDQSFGAYGGAFSRCRSWRPTRCRVEPKPPATRLLTVAGSPRWTKPSRRPTQPRSWPGPGTCRRPVLQAG